MATTAERLVEAEAALHDLSIGRGIALVRDSDGSEVRYTKADIGALIGYIATLKGEIAATDRPVYTGPMRVIF